MDVDVYFEEQNIHTTDGDGELLLTILASFAQEESLSARENQKWRIQINYREGKPVTTIRIYGYRCLKEVCTVVPEEAAVVRMVFKDYLSGLGKNAIMCIHIRIICTMQIALTTSICTNATFKNSRKSIVFHRLLCTEKYAFLEKFIRDIAKHQSELVSFNEKLLIIVAEHK